MNDINNNVLDFSLKNQMIVDFENELTKTNLFAQSIQKDVKKQNEEFTNNYDDDIYIF